MRRRIVNRHRIARKLKVRKAKAKLGRVSRTRRSMKKRDYAWAPARNPYRVKQSISVGVRIKLSLIVLLIIGSAGLIVYHPFFYIDKFSVNGLQRVSESEFETALSSIINYKKFLIFPGQTYLFVSEGEISSILSERFPLQSVVVKKTFPNSLSVVIEERLSTVIYDNGSSYSYLGLGGNVVEVAQNVTAAEWQEKTQVTTTTLADGTVREEVVVLERNHTPAVARVLSEIGKYPLVFDTRQIPVEVNAQVLSKETVSSIIEWYNLFERKSDIPFGYMIISGDGGEATIKTREGWEVYVRLNDVKKQFDELLFLLQEKIDRGGHINYVDLRYDGRVYWQ